MIELYTAATPNGRKISIALEEMALPYTLHYINLKENVQKEPWFLKINPNGRIPAIVDKDNGDFAVFESGAILIYLAEKSGQFLPEDPKARSRAIQWLMFQMSGIGPMQRQANVFLRYADEKIPFAIHRYQNETRRLYEVLNQQLDNKDYINGAYSIVDMATFPWVIGYEWSAINIEGLPHLQNWLLRMSERPAVAKAMTIPPDASEEKRQMYEDTLLHLKKMTGK